MHQVDLFGQKSEQKGERKWEGSTPLFIITEGKSKTSAEKNVTKLNLEKCEQASILLDNLSTFEEISNIEEGPCYKTNAVDNASVFNWQIRNVEGKSPLSGKLTEEDLICNLYRYIGVPGADKGVVSEWNSYTGNGIPRNGENINYHAHMEDGEEVQRDNYKRGENIRHSPRGDSITSHYSGKIQAVCPKDGNNVRTKKKENVNKYVFNLRTGKKELIKDKKGNFTNPEKTITYVNKCDRNEVDYRKEKKLKEQARMHGEEKEKMKKNFEEMIKGIREKYQTQEEKEKKLIRSIYSKYMNMRNELSKMKSITENVKSENKKFKEEVNRLTANPVESTLLDGYKSKLDEYIVLANCKGNKIQQLEREIESMRSSAELLARRNSTLVEEKRRLLKGNEILKRSNVQLQMDFENARKENEQLRNELFYKDMKMNYLVSILNVVDETILGDSGCGEVQRGKAAQGAGTTERGGHEGNRQTDKHTSADDAKNSTHRPTKPEACAIQKMNKKILIKSIVQKIKDINKKVRRGEERRVGALRSNVGVAQEEACPEVIKQNDKDGGREKQNGSSQVMEAYFNSENFTLSESVREASTGENAHAAFFVNVPNADGKPFNHCTDELDQVGEDPSDIVWVTGGDNKAERSDEAE
ncbi:conserved Plasmodium protein, unknown function [Plasmodium knowlesi strain H]|uniref:Uncharacterized protein n=3 Tax=Plasmodium knowlesi TaxID=5850 RepID=A0A5K1U5F0_PLAKH|nr:conserved Plasmodium protein, unknown function [Plasmodium knowlesi strain H]OTN66557.1 Uncharacterized protein PKNOH_S08492500 [Plasmodium knowlesi]CAA9986806.1 conserved Plasmodium protein, unknown function [Plasmodium knowlesi strain H]SBO23654.1 conserved Plasmodium protein, unknown function [Plasmodium knowlesi strain H]SBO25224.1 conserved Plasmodium protein, unknown function [Plasmodium knowlesi strain H]VVS76280.1 conserved Plasmodium protein, unknown function [Plasmodium knowlesi s|eukprot:XP_002257990.1 hypothetical protein, conserved in Plasmodium species [Plasmodium knowlesi strain H]